MASLSQTWNEGILFLPRLFVALVLLLAGIVLGEMARRRVDRLSGQMDLPGRSGRSPRRSWLFGVTALGQLGIPIEVLLLLAGILLAAADLMFSPGAATWPARSAPAATWRRASTSGRDLGRRHARSHQAIEATCTVLEQSDGEPVRIPNSQLIARPFTEHAAR